MLQTVKEVGELAIKIIHIMADGSIRDTMKGVTVPYEQTKLAYELLEEIKENKKRNSLVTKF